MNTTATPAPQSAPTAPASPACVIPTLADVENWGRDGRQEGFFIFFEGKHCGWTCRLLSRGAPDAITSWRPGCVAIRADGKPGAWRAVGGSYYSGADRWEAIA